MSKYLKSILLSLVIAVTFSGSANAQSPAPLSENEQRIQQHSQEMEQKAEILQLTDKELAELEAKKQELVKVLEAEKKLIEELKAKIAEKKRLEAIRAEEEKERARQRELATISPEVTQASYTPPTKRYAANSAGNTYYAGQCTWHVKNLKPELPNMLGNADMWFYNAQRQGWPVGYTAQAGAAAQKKVGMHVAYVMEVYGNGTMLISEMNYAGPYSQRTAVVNQDDYLYVY